MKRDPVTFGATLGVILAAAAGASAWSAWRTSRIDALVRCGGSSASLTADARVDLRATLLLTANVSARRAR